MHIDTVVKTTALTSHRQPLRALTGIRFFAAMQVVLFHFGASIALRNPRTRFLGYFLANGWIAVSLFFILSGFILSYTYTNRIETPGGKWRFWEARFARIYPVYLLSLLLNLPFRGNLTVGLGLSVLMMVQAWNPECPSCAQAWNAPAWTLSVEMFFYLLFPFLLPRIERLSDRTLKAILGIVLIVIVFGHTTAPEIVEPLSQKMYIPVPVFRLPEFILGMILGLLFIRNGEGRREATSTYVSFSTYASLAAITAILFSLHDKWLSLIILPFAALIYSMATTRSHVERLLASDMFVLLGGASYAVYLLQVPVRSWVHFAFTGTSDLRLQHAGADGPVSPVILIATSVVVFLYFEDPMRKALRACFLQASRRKTLLP